MRLDYTQEEKDAEIEFIKQYVKKKLYKRHKNRAGLFYQITKEDSGLSADTNDIFTAHYEVINTLTNECYQDPEG